MEKIIHEFDSDKEGTGVIASCSECDWGMDVKLFENNSEAKLAFAYSHYGMEKVL